MFSWFDLCWQEIPKTSQIPKTFSKHLRTSRQVRLSKMLTLQRCWHHSATSGAISQSMCGRSSMSMNLWALQPNYIVDKIWQKKSSQVLGTLYILIPTSKTTKVWQPDGLRNSSPLAWILSWSSEKLQGSRGRPRRTWACETVFGQLWLSTTGRSKRTAWGNKVLFCFFNVLCYFIACNQYYIIIN